MPRGDGTGPMEGSQSIAGRPGSWETRPSSGPGGECICPICGKALPHRRGNPCSRNVCPKCGVAMIRRD